MLRISADGARDDELAHVVDAALLEDVRAHDEVCVPVTAGVGAVRADSAHLGGEMKDEVGPRLREEPGGVLHRRQVVVAAARHDDLLPVGLEALDEVRADEATAAGDEYAHGRQLIPGGRPRSRSGERGGRQATAS